MSDTYSIKLADGTLLENLAMNGNNYIYHGTLDTSILNDDNLMPTIIINDDFEECHEHMRYVEPYFDDPGNTWFVLVDRTPEEVHQAKFEAAISVMAQTTLDDTLAEMAAILFPEWSGDGVAYSTGDRVRYNERLAKCLQDHKSQADWAPGVAVSLWTWISDPGEDWPEWVQPTGAHDAYSAKAQVSHNGKHWVSDTDGNVWEPGVYGWTEQN